jgi:hypothetical protein
MEEKIHESCRRVKDGGGILAAQQEIKPKA